MSLQHIRYELSSNVILRNGIFVIGKPNEINPPIFTQIDTEYIIVSGNTNEYHPINSPSANKPRPTATKSVADLFPFKYDIIVSIEPYTNKINETARNTYSRETNDTRNSGSTPTDLKYLDLGKKVLIVWENAINQYPTTWVATPNVEIPLLISPVLKIKSSRINPAANIPKPIPIAKKAIDNLNNVGLAVFLNPIYEIVPITRPTKSPIRFRIISRKNSNYADSVTVLNKVWEQVF